MSKDNTCAGFGAEILGDTQNARAHDDGRPPWLEFEFPNHEQILAMAPWDDRLVVVTTDGVWVRVPSEVGGFTMHKVAFR